MALKNGLYGVSFETPRGRGTGVAYLHDGKLHGGDSMMAYAGKFSEEGGRVKASVRAFMHASVPNMESILGPDAVDIVFSGTADQNGARLTGTSPQAPGVEMSLTLKDIDALAR